MKNLVAIFLATALLSGCGGGSGSNTDNFTGSEYSDFHNWCKDSIHPTKAPWNLIDLQCESYANDLEEKINEDGWDKTCLVLYYKQVLVNERLEFTNIKTNKCRF
jgi:hypothetical protein